MPTICDGGLSVYQFAQLREELICMSVHVQMGDKLKVSCCSTLSRTSVTNSCNLSTIFIQAHSENSPMFFYKSKKSIQIYVSDERCFYCILYQICATL